MSAEQIMVPCPHCFESSGYVWEHGNDWATGPWSVQTSIPCSECSGAGTVPREAPVEAAAKAAFRAAQRFYRADYDHFPLKYTWETTDESVRQGWRDVAKAVLVVAAEHEGRS